MELVAAGWLSYSEVRILVLLLLRAKAELEEVRMELEEVEEVD